MSVLFPAPFRQPSESVALQRTARCQRFADFEFAGEFRRSPYSLGRTNIATMYPIAPIFGGISSSPNQISRIRVTSMSKYSAKPAHTPAIFFRARIRRSLRGAAPIALTPDSPATASAVDFPHSVQDRARRRAARHPSGP